MDNPQPGLLEISNLHDLFIQRNKQSYNKIAYRQYDTKKEVWEEWLWNDVMSQVVLWQKALHNEGLLRASRIAIMLPNGVQWIVCDQAILSLGMVVVPIFSHDNAGNVQHILQDSSTQILITDNVRWNQISKTINPEYLKRIIIIGNNESSVSNVIGVEQWLTASGTFNLPGLSPSDIATLVYTSGTTGAPKGVVLTHHNILANIKGILHSFPISIDNLFLSFLPLSHIFERTVGYYMSMYIGAELAFSRSVNQLKDDMCVHQPTMLLAVPRVYDGIYSQIRTSISKAPRIVQRLFDMVSTTTESEQDISYRLACKFLNLLIGKRIRNVFGGRMRYALSGGAALSPNVARLFIALQVPIYQGYGLTETSPVIAVNRQDDNMPSSIGQCIDGVEVKISKQSELLTRSEYVMKEYWNLPQATQSAIDKDNWFHTGDQAKIDQKGRIYITGRIKEIIVMSSGEKVPPVDIENMLLTNLKFDQVMVYGENRSYLIALLVFNEEYVAEYLDIIDGIDSQLKSSHQKELLKEISQMMMKFPSYAKIRRVIVTNKPWTIENGLLTPTLKLKRNEITQQFIYRIEEVYQSL